MKVLSLFDGMACGMLAMMQAGITVDRYVAYEIDKYAVQTSTHNFPMIEHRGDVFGADFTEYCGFDFLVGGSPCTYWSVAQKNNRETEAIGMGWELFSQYVRALHEAQPHYFIYENNKSMSNAIRDSITGAFGFEPVCINSALVSAQNRQRLYWVGKRNFDGTYSRVHVELPEDSGILLRDVLEGMTDKEKGRSVIASIGRTTTREYFKKHQGTMAFEPLLSPAEPFGETNGKAYALTASYWKGQPKNKILDKSQRSHVAEPVNITAEPVEWDKQGRPVKARSCVDGKTHTVYEVKDGQMTIKCSQYQVKLDDGFYIIRKLTINECKRLQTVPEWYKFPVSDTQAYKMLGNGWTVEVIAHLIKATQSGALEEKQLSLFEMVGV